MSNGSFPNSDRERCALPWYSDKLAAMISLTMLHYWLMK
jgi:hypothetical protein